MATILVVEDDKSTQKLTAARLKPHYNILCADNGEQALSLIYDNPIDLIIADVMMPKMDGVTLLKTLREKGFQTPVLLLTAKQSMDDKREGFSAGTDDYLTKPVDYEELIWHVQALLRRSNINDKNKIEIGTLSLDASNYQVLLEKESIVIPKKEFELLFKLLSYPDRIFTKAQLLDEIWGYNSESSEDTVKTHINRLRSHFSDCNAFEVVTIKGIGYKAVVRKEEPS